MNKEKDEKALKAFWCMLESAESKGREIFYTSNQINIYTNEKKFTGVIGNIGYQEREKAEVKRQFFGIPIVKKYTKEYFIFGKVINPKDSEIFHFSFSGEKVEPIKKRIKNSIENVKNKETEERNKSLESLIC